jgi:hypothetical protein
MIIMKIKFDSNDLYCLICHDVYPNPLYAPNKELCFDNWIFVSIHKTRFAISNIETIQTPMICPDCIKKCKLDDLEFKIQQFSNWKNSMYNGKEFEK